MFGKQRQTGRIVMTVLAVCLIAAASVAVYSLRDSLFAQNDPETGTPTTGSTTAPTTARTVREAADPVTNVPDTRTTAPTTEVQGALYVLPVSNTVAAAFSREPVHSETMGDWRTHNGTDFAAELGDEVMAITDGEVIAVEEDAFFGTVVRVRHGELTAAYCGVIPDEGLAKGSKVKTGERLGTLTIVPCELLDGAHLHLELTENGNYLDPVAVINKEVKEKP